MKILVALLLLLPSPRAVTPAYVLVSLHPQTFTAVQQLLPVVAEHLYQDGMIVEAPFGTPPPTIFVVGGFELPITGAVPVKAAAGRVRWRCVTPHQLVVGMPFGQAWCWVEGPAMPSNRVGTRIR